MREARKEFRLTEAQQQVVENNMGLVGLVINERVRDIKRMGLFTYDDLFQMGCEGLCRAVATDTQTHSASFSTYAYRVIYNEICDAMRYAGVRRRRECVTDPKEIEECTGNVLDEVQTETDFERVIQILMKDESEPIRKGVRAILLQANGYSYIEIGRQLEAKPSVVRVWASRARQRIREMPEFPLALAG